jgi:signal transduction histidine kinase
VSAKNHLHHTDISLLYVEDESATRMQVSRILTAKGYRLTIAEDGLQGLQAYREYLPDIVLTDIMMPRMNGLDMAREIRKISPEVQIICMTAFNDTSYLIEAIDIGINQFVLKPVELNKLLEALKHCQGLLEYKKLLRRQEAESLRTRKMEAISILAGGMAHDFNNLLQVVLGYVSLARMNAEPGSKTEKLLEVAENSSETAQELGKRLLTFAKGGNGHMQVAEIAPIILNAANQELGSSAITCAFDIPDNLPPLRVDVAQIGQVFIHLTINAREAMPQGGALKVSVATMNLPSANELSLEPGEYLHIIYEDSGIGIPPENMPKIFDPYFTTKEIGCQKGMGLGLALSHSIIKHHHGQIIAESEPGKGTIMHIYLPLLPPKTGDS